MGFYTSIGRTINNIPLHDTYRESQGLWQTRNENGKQKFNVLYVCFMYLRQAQTNTQFRIKIYINYNFITLQDPPSDFIVAKPRTAFKPVSSQYRPLCKLCTKMISLKEKPHLPATYAKMQSALSAVQKPEPTLVTSAQSQHHQLCNLINLNWV